MRKRSFRKIIRIIFFVGIILSLLFTSAFSLWVASLEVPTLDGFSARQVRQSTKIFDRTGKILLYDLHEDIRRTVVPLEKVSRHIKNATLAIEDAEFYEHHGVRTESVVRAVLANLKTGSYGQGGSTITQQVVKMALLTPEKTISRKIKEWILAVKLERMMEKEKIFEIYLNETPYGGTVYGIEEASQFYFGKNAEDVSIAEAAYLAALPQAPSYYSPYGGHLEELEARKNLVLREMLENNFITEEEYRDSLNEKAKFEKYGEENIKAPHFVFFVREYLEEKYGREAVYSGGLKVISTLNYEMQKHAEEVIRKHAEINSRDFNASNAALTAIDPKTGQILAMVGSRDYFDEKIDGKFNVATALRQPGSTFKPIAYATAFEKGYTSETVLFDVPTQFSNECEPNDTSTEPPCYSPGNYDDRFRGPMTIRNALAQSINIPAVKALYLAGINDTIDTARRMGITSLTKSANHYGFSLVLGGGEVSLLELTGAFATFANDGMNNKLTGILKIEDSAGTLLEEYKSKSTRAISAESARTTTDILSDNEARIPAYGVNNYLDFRDRQVASKTGTTNSYRDTWVVGYSPNLAVGAWVGNNDNTPIAKRVAGFVTAPLWREFMNKALPLLPEGNFASPDRASLEGLKPVLSGSWQGDDGTTHTILHLVQKNDPRGAPPRNPQADPQYANWEYAVRLWASSHNMPVGQREVYPPQSDFEPGIIFPKTTKPLQTFNITNPTENAYLPAGSLLTVTVNIPSPETRKVDYYLDEVFMGSVRQPPFSITLIPQRGASSLHSIRAVADAGFAGTFVDEVQFLVE